jgi:uncharacterized protein (TIGR03435 family)
MRWIALTALFATALVSWRFAHAQSPAAAPTSLKFEVASLKPTPPDPQAPFGIRPAPGGERYVASNVTLRLIMTVAFRVRDEQIAGGPDWINTARFDMNAKAEHPSSVEELHVMLQNLLAERFKLQFHHETKELPIYALTIDKDGPKLQPHQAGSGGDPWIDQNAEQFLHMAWHAKFAPMDFFAWRLSLILDRPVIDQTRLAGGYDFDLKFTRDLPPGISEGAQVNGAPIDTSGPTIFQAVRQQLGLKLESKKGPVDILVIDRAEKPVEN